MTDGEWDEKLVERAKEKARSAKPEEVRAAREHASQFIDTLPFKGERLTAIQKSAWPRRGVFRDDGAPITGVPPEIEEATYLVATFILAEVPYTGDAMAWVFALIGHLVEENREAFVGTVTWH